MVYFANVQILILFPILVPDTVVALFLDVAVLTEATARFAVAGNLSAHAEHGVQAKAYLPHPRFVVWSFHSFAISGFVL